MASIRRAVRGLCRMPIGTLHSRMLICGTVIA